MMRTTTIIAILVLGLMVCQTKLCQATPMGTAFTYQGRLIDANTTADGLYDFAFKLYDANVGGSKAGTDVNVADVDVIDGYFTVELDFGSAGFGGDARWLEVGVRPGDSNDPNAFVTLSPRQEVTPTPYAVYAGTTGGVEVPLTLSGSSSGPIIEAINTGYGEVMCARHDNSGSFGRVAGMNYGVSAYGAGSQGTGVIGFAPGIRGYGGWFQAAGTSGYGVYGEATASSGTNYGVYGKTNSPSGYAGYFEGSIKVSGKWSGTGVIFPDGTKQTTAASSPAADITAVNAGDGLTGGGTEGDVTLSVEVPLDLSGYSPLEVLRVTNSGMGKALFAEAADTRNVINYGGYFTAAGEGGRGVYGDANNTAGLVNYGGYFVAGASSGVGVYGEGSNSGDGANYGGLFRAYGYYGRGVYGYASGTEGYGVYGYAIGSSGHGVHGETNNINGRGVYGYASGAEGYGVYAHADGTNGTGIYAKADGANGTGIYGSHEGTGNYGSLGGPDFGVKSSGDLVVYSGAYRGNISSSSGSDGAPFPRPAYDSGWISISPDESIILSHNIGGNVDNYVVNTTKRLAGWNIEDAQGAPPEAVWGGLNSSSITLSDLTDMVTYEVRVRIWVYN